MIVTVAGHQVQHLRLCVPHSGAWFAEVTFLEAPDVSGRVLLALGSTNLMGSVVERMSGTRGLQRRALIVGGSGGWSQMLPPKSYHNDAQVKALLVAQDAARECGEELGSFAPADDRLGAHFVRRSGPASAALKAAAGGRPWWVDYQGVTHVGDRPAPQIEPGAVEVVDFDASANVVTLQTDDISSIPVGGVLSDGLDAPQTIRDLEIVIEEERLLIYAWCGGDVSSRGAVMDPLRRLVQAIAGEDLHGTYRYRVVGMSGDRVDLQIVRRRTGLPDVLPVSMMPGMAGVHAELSPGSEVLVQFADGDAAQPVVTHFAGRDGAGWLPVSLDIMGGDKGAARVDDDVEVTIPSGTFLVSAQDGVPNADPVKVTGKITSGSSKVVIG